MIRINVHCPSKVPLSTGKCTESCIEKSEFFLQQTYSTSAVLYTVTEGYTIVENFAH